MVSTPWLAWRALLAKRRARLPALRMGGVLTGGSSRPSHPGPRLRVRTQLYSGSGSLQRCSSRSARSGRRAGSGAPRVREARFLHARRRRIPLHPTNASGERPLVERDGRSVWEGKRRGDKFLQCLLLKAERTCFTPHRMSASDPERKSHDKGKDRTWPAPQGSNLQPSGSKPDALSS